MNFNRAVERVIGFVAQRPVMPTPSVNARRGSPRVLSGEGLIKGHEVSGNKVAAYETHWILGFEFVFAFVPWPREKHRIYIIKSPSYGSRRDDCHSTHRLDDRENSRKFICVDARAYPETITDARELALMWAQATARYIKTGRKFI